MQKFFRHTRSPLSSEQDFSQSKNPSNSLEDFIGHFHDCAIKTLRQRCGNSTANDQLFSHNNLTSQGVLILPDFLNIQMFEKKKEKKSTHHRRSHLNEYVCGEKLLSSRSPLTGAATQSWPSIVPYSRGRINDVGDG